LSLARRYPVQQRTVTRLCCATTLGYIATHTCGVVCVYVVVDVKVSVSIMYERWTHERIEEHRVYKIRKKKKRRGSVKKVTHNWSTLLILVLFEFHSQWVGYQVTRHDKKQMCTITSLSSKRRWGCVPLRLEGWGRGQRHAALGPERCPPRCCACTERSDVGSSCC
jgi:hypothetical protein